MINARRMTLQEFVLTHTEKVTLGMADTYDVDMVFFGINVICDPDRDKLLELIPYHGTFGNAPIKLNDGGVHNFIEVGAWLGDQDMALRLMALGAHLGLWRIVSPLGVQREMPRAESIAMAKIGMLAVVTDPVE